jgi:glutathione S-transferase
LVAPGGIFTEMPAMLAFLAQSHPEARLAPLDDPLAFRQLRAFASYLCSTLQVAHAHRMRGHRWADDEAATAGMQRKVPHSVGGCYSLIERHLLKGPWVIGEDYSIAAPYLFTLAQWLEADGVIPTHIPRGIDHRRRMSERPAVKQAIADEMAG